MTRTTITVSPLPNLMTSPEVVPLVRRQGRPPHSPREWFRVMGCDKSIPVPPPSHGGHCATGGVDQGPLSDRLLLAKRERESPSFTPEVSIHPKK